MDCFQDFCLFCDRESHDGPYCSQGCKLADLERSSMSNPVSPASSTSSRWSQPSPTAGYVPVSASTAPLSSLGYTAPSGSDGRRSQSSYFMWTASQSTADSSPERALTPSSSRTSLSSTMSFSNSTPTTSTSTTNTINIGLSSQAKQDLHGYFNSFDQARAAKRRSSTR